MPAARDKRGKRRADFAGFAGIVEIDGFLVHGMAAGRWPTTGLPSGERRISPAVAAASNPFQIPQPGVNLIWRGASTRIPAEVGCGETTQKRINSKDWNGSCFIPAVIVNRRATTTQGVYRDEK
jgi:hypothetical protein